MVQTNVHLDIHWPGWLVSLFVRTHFSAWQIVVVWHNLLHATQQGPYPQAAQHWWRTASIFSVDGVACANAQYDSPYPYQPPDSIYPPVQNKYPVLNRALLWMCAGSIDLLFNGCDQTTEAPLRPCPSRREKDTMKRKSCSAVFINKQHVKAHPQSVDLKMNNSATTQVETADSLKMAINQT